MKTFTTITFVSAVCLLSSCNKCPVPQNEGNNSLTGWSISNLAAPNPMREDGGVIFIVSDGNAASTATKVFNCGSGRNCNLTFSLAAPTVESGGESVSVIFESSSLPQPRVITYRRQPVAGEHPVNLTFRFCGSIRVTVRGNEGSAPGMQNQYSVGPFYYKCMDCPIEEKGHLGT